MGYSVNLRVFVFVIIKKKKNLETELIILLDI